MSHFSISFSSVPAARRSRLRSAHRRIARTLSKFRPLRRPKSDMDHLARFSDAELADIGLLRTELWTDPVDTATDAQARAMLRVYR